MQLSNKTGQPPAYQESVLANWLTGKSCGVCQILRLCVDVEFSGFPQATYCDCCNKVVWEGEEPQNWTIEWVPSSPNRDE